MSLVDILIIVFLVVGVAVGFKQGFTKTLINFIGVVLVICLSFIFKNPVSEFLMNVMPFIPFGGVIKGVTVLNIALYEVIAFMVVYSVLMIVLKVLMFTTTIFEKILNFTIVLGLPSKILGAVIGLVKNYVITFFVLYFLAMPNFSEVSIVKESKLKDPILKYTPVLSNFAGDALETLDEFRSLTKKYKDIDDVNQFNLETLDVLLKYKITSVKTVKNLINSGKISIKDVDQVLDKYKE